MNRLKLEALASSILIYLIIIVAIFSVALYSPSTPKAKTFTEKKSEIIEVSLGSPTPKASHSKAKHKSKAKKKKEKVEKKPKKVVKKVRNIKSDKPVKKVTKKIKKPTKKVTKKRIKAAKKPKKVAKNSKPNASNLFKNIPKNIANDKAEDKPLGKAGKSLKKANQSSGIVNKYFANIQNTLKGWPAQSNFAGEKVNVKLTVYSSGLFDYKILTRSLNPEFNRALKAYLEQLKKFGFGPHSNPKPYNIIVEFIAK